MPDVFDSAKRSRVMSRIHGKGNTTTEIALARALRKAGITGWRRHVKLTLILKAGRASDAEKLAVLVVKPDFIFRQAKLAVFVDGCFWHQCPLHSKVPENNRAFWERKLTRNVERDRASNRALKAGGWRVLRIWEHALKRPSRAVAQVRRRLSRKRTLSG